MRRHTARYGAGAVLLGEANVAPDKLGPFFGNGDELNQLFNFIGAERIFLAMARQDAAPIRELPKLLPALPPSTQWLNFLRHHDELSLQWLDQNERQEIFRAFGPRSSQQIYGRGLRLRLRLAGMLNGDQGRIRLALSLLFSRSGSPMLYYGDEIGMGEDLTLPDRLPVRTCMQWSGEINGGFSSAPRERLIRPVIGNGPFAYQAVNVTRQWQDPDSQLHWVHRMIEARRSCPELGLGRHEWLTCDGGKAVLAESLYIGNSRLVCVHNLAQAACRVRIRHDALAGKTCFELLRKISLRASAEGELTLDLSAYGHLWLRVGSIFGPAELGAMTDSEIVTVPPPAW